MSSTTLAQAGVSIDASRATHTVSPLLFGLFFEDINHAADGGLNANLVNNHSFEAIYLDRGQSTAGSFAVSLVLKRPPRSRSDRARHWSTTGGTLEVRGDSPVTAGTHYARISSAGGAVVTNNGYIGNGPSMGARAGVALNFSAAVRSRTFTGRLILRLTDVNGTSLGESSVTLPTATGWSTITTAVIPDRTTLAAMQLVLDGTGELDLDEVFLVPADHWGAGDPRWSQGVLRRDLVETLQALHPSFMRFPGGCVVEGFDCEHAYDWRTTVGPLANRTSTYNLWSTGKDGGDYSQSNQIGFYEFFLLCEDLGMEPVPVLNAGLSCQFRSRDRLPLDSDEFADLIQSAIDMIDWATADPATNAWARLRADAGHPEPFALKTIAIGNENHSEPYLERFAPIRAAVDRHHPGLNIIMSAGGSSSGKAFEKTWAVARTQAGRTIVDEHMYRAPKWFVEHATTRYDSYDRNGPKVFVGEWAAHSALPSLPGRPAPANTWESAVAEAAFLTGVIRNSDVVAMTCYAPLLAFEGHTQWTHNLIPFTPLAVHPTVNYTVQQLMATRTGDRYVPLEGSLPDQVFGSSVLRGSLQLIHLVNADKAAHGVTLHVGNPDTTTARVRTYAAAEDFRNVIGEPALRPRESDAAVSGGAVSLRLAPHSITVVEVVV